jgi:SAM-dependent methyltransferase
MVGKEIDPRLAAAVTDEVISFYDALAPEYDRMVRFQQRVEAETQNLQAIVERFGIRRAVDAGCGTGLHAIVLARLGVKVTAVDVSREMVERARANADHLSVEIDWHTAAFEKLPQIVTAPVDALFCLGNTLAHIPPGLPLRRQLDVFQGVLKARGVLILQLLNYTRILREKERVVDVRRVGRQIFIRFYDFLPGGLRFNLMILEENGTDLHHRLQSVSLFPHRFPELKAALRKAGFSTVEAFAGWDGTPFQEEHAKNLLIFARK